MLLCISCESEETRFERSLTPIGLMDTTLFRDPTGKVYIRLPYRYVHEDISQDPPYNYEDLMYLGDSSVSLSQGLDIPSFRRIPGTANYWQDRRFVYTDPWVPYPGQYFFFVLGRRREVHFLPNPDFVRVRGVLYYRGVRVPGDTVPKSGHYP
ncbi:hypothetical protein [Hymenobacter negativus]|uniref:Uncharacterized protein n=1 Tax=Hymenobacter negativus TaxID=2795026 RepID=A0ABS3QLR5_9BACT|nr:hypothetical protein [Hymenobacter negativus]MBO2012215.1 hypothetical protein [Hymenobacter negativus]